MKAISASIVALAGAVILAAGGMTTHGDSQTVLYLLGAAVGLVGLVTWWQYLSREDG